MKKKWLVQLYFAEDTTEDFIANWTDEEQEEYSNRLSRLSVKNKMGWCITNLDFLTSQTTQLEDVVRALEKAVENQETKNKPKSWWSRLGAIIADVLDHPDGYPNEK